MGLYGKVQWVYLRNKVPMAYMAIKGRDIRATEDITVVVRNFAGDLRTYRRKGGMGVGTATRRKYIRRYRVCGGIRTVILLRADFRKKIRYEYRSIDEKRNCATVACAARAYPILQIHAIMGVIRTSALRGAPQYIGNVAGGVAGVISAPNMSRYPPRPRHGGGVQAGDPASGAVSLVRCRGQVRVIAFPDIAQELGVVRRSASLRPREVFGRPAGNIDPFVAIASPLRERIVLRFDGGSRFR